MKNPPQTIDPSKHSPFLHIGIINSARACSTLSIGSIPAEFSSAMGESHSFNSTLQLKDFCSFENFLLKFEKGIHHFDENSEMGWRVNRRLRFSDFAAMMVSTIREQDLAQKYLERLGFISTPEVRNIKNDTDVKVYFLDIPTLMVNLKEFGVEYEHFDTKVKSYLTKTK